MSASWRTEVLLLVLLTTASLQSGVQETNDALEGLQEIQTKAEAMKSAEEFLAETSEGLQELKTKAETGDAEAQSSLGQAYYLGEGVPKDYAEAVKWWRKAAEQGNAVAQNNLGSAYFSGKGVPRDAVEAVKWYRKSAEQGNAVAQFNLGGAYGDGEGVPKDEVEAVKWYRKAAEQGLADAQSNLGCAYYFGQGVPKDYVEGVKWFRKAAEQGNADAQFNVGVAYGKGEGVPKDYVQAYFWFNLAAAGNLEEAARIRSLLEPEMTREQIAEAQRLSAQFVPRKTSTDTINDLRPSLFATASATAFFVTPDGYLLTSYHVVENASRLQVVTPKGTFPARLVKSDPANDLALLKVSGNFSCLPLQSSRGERVGAAVFTVGFPNIGLQGREPKLAEGTIASLSGVQDDPRYFQISVPIQPGNSGGALVNSKGNVVGVIAAKLSQLAALRSSGSLPEGVNYAVKSSYALSLLESVPEASARLKEPNAREGRLADLVDAVKAASALVLVEE